MKIPFVKVHGAKNDFLLTDTREAGTANLAKIAIAICDRYTGVGADGWILVDHRLRDSCDASIHLFNSDGSEPELSGNGTRCVAALLLRGKDSGEVRILTGAGTRHLRLIERNGPEYQFEMNMGEIRVIELNTTVQGRDAVILNAGNPQCSLPVGDFDFDWRAVGKSVEHDLRFPHRTNVSFIRSIDRHTIDVRFWERGAGETNSSGTGASGAATAAVARGMAESPVTVLTPAGPLMIRLEGSLYLKGPAELIAEGTYFYEHRSGIAC